jgi:tetratricopeptide (TPR) repeat protein
VIHHNHRRNKRTVSYSAITLFAHSARRARVGFALSEQNRVDVAHICQLVEGMPLAIELAATWVPMLSCHEIAHEIDRNLDFLAVLVRNLPERHRSIRAVFDQSWKLLLKEERQVLRQLSVFRGGFTHAAAEQVAGATLGLISALVSKSLLRRTETGRYDLHELVRQYGAEKLLESGERETICQRHLDFYLELAEAVEPRLTGPNLSIWIERLEQDNDNLRAALDWGLQRDVESALRLAGTLRMFWSLNQVREGSEWLLKALKAAASSPQSVSAAARANALWNAARLAQDFAQSTALARESLALARQAGDKRSLANALIILAADAWRQGDEARAMAQFEESLSVFQEIGDKLGMAEVLEQRGVAERFRGRYPEAIALHEASLAVARETQSLFFLANATTNLGVLAMRTGDFRRAQTLLEESLNLWETARSKPGQAWSFAILARTVGFQGNYAQAMCLLEQSAALFRDAGSVSVDTVILDYALMGDVAYAQGDLQRAAEFYEAAKTELDIADPMLRGGITLGLGNIARAQGDYERAARMIEESLERSQATNDSWYHSLSLYALGKVCWAQHQVKQAHQLFVRSLTEAHKLGDKRGIAQCLEGLAGVGVSAGQPLHAVQLFATAEALREAMSAPLPPVERADYEHSLAAARAQLDEAMFAAAWTAGHAMSLEEAITEALGLAVF